LKASFKPRMKASSILYGFKACRSAKRIFFHRVALPSGLAGSVITKFTVWLLGESAAGDPPISVSRLAIAAAEYVCLIKKAPSRPVVRHITRSHQIHFSWVFYAAVLVSLFKRFPNLSSASPVSCTEHHRLSTRP
jgi:hypothetical protein